MFRALGSDQFPPLGKLRLALPEVPNKSGDLAEVHLFTGVNGTGKTRLLSLVAAFLGNDEPLKKRFKGIQAITQVAACDTLPSPDPLRLWPAKGQISESEFSWLQHGPLNTWLSLVPAFAYSGTAYVTDAEISVMGNVTKPSRAACLAFVRPPSDSQGLLQAVTNLKLQAAMDSMGDETDAPKQMRSGNIVKALELTISAITGRRFAFDLTAYPALLLRAKWGGMRLAFDVLPDGLRSIIGWLVHSAVMLDVWMQGKGDPFQSEAVFLLDEIEGPLHPAWQRRILPAFQRLFPKAQIFIATHSPFVISSLNHGWIHSLTMSEGGEVTVKPPHPASEGDSYISVVEEIMGIKEWYDPETEGLLEEFRVNRDAAYHGDLQASGKAKELALKIGSRSSELNFMMGKELSQMDRQLAAATASK